MIAESEDGFVGWIIDLAHHHGWLAAHFRPAQGRDGRWVTPMQGDKGFPDVILARGGRIVFIEAKREKGGVVSPAQRAWLEELDPAPQLCPEWACGGDGGVAHSVHVFRPSDRAAIEELLK